MKKTFTILSLLMFFGNTPAVEKVELSMNEFAWKKRQLIVFSPSDTHQAYLRFKMIEEKEKPGFNERNLHTWHVIAEKKVKLSTNQTTHFSNQEARDHFQVNIDQFRIILIGYDQGEKLRQTNVDIDFLFSKIDQMPMRIQEMQNN